VPRNSRISNLEMGTFPEILLFFSIKFRSESSLVLQHHQVSYIFLFLCCLLNSTVSFLNNLLLVQFLSIIIQLIQCQVCHISSTNMGCVKE
jgi:hypothetical protein